MIEFDESEYLESTVDDATLLLVLLFCGQEAKDKLLYRSPPCTTTYSLQSNRSLDTA